MASSFTSRPWVAPVMNILVPVSRSRSARRSSVARTRPRSQPASDSVAPKMESGRPAARPGSSRACCSTLPKPVTADTAPIDECTASRPAHVGTFAASRVITRVRSSIDTPLPPNASGTASPQSPASPSTASATAENVPVCGGGGSSIGGATAGGVANGS